MEGYQSISAVLAAQTQNTKKEATNTQACNRRDRNEQDSTDQQIQGHARSTKGNQGGRPKRIPTVTEVYSRPRVTADAETHVPGHMKTQRMTYALDMTSPMKRQGAQQKRKSTRRTLMWC